MIIKQLPADMSDRERLKVIAAFEALQSIIAILDQNDVRLTVEQRPHVLSFEEDC
jgi:hypothetical protein